MILLRNTVHLLAAGTPFARILDVVKHAQPPKQAVREFKCSRGAVVTCQVMDLV